MFIAWSVGQNQPATAAPQFTGGGVILWGFVAGTAVTRNLPAQLCLKSFPAYTLDLDKSGPTLIVAAVPTFLLALHAAAADAVAIASGAASVAALEENVAGVVALEAGDATVIALQESGASAVILAEAGADAVAVEAIAAGATLLDSTASYTLSLQEFPL